MGFSRARRVGLSPSRISALFKGKPKTDRLAEALAILSERVD